MDIATSLVLLAVCVVSGVAVEVSARRRRNRARQAAGR